MPNADNPNDRSVERAALKPCPFCGSDDVQRAGERPGCDYYWTKCDGCGASTDEVYPDQEAADEKWNRRATLERAEVGSVVPEPGNPEQQARDLLERMGIESAQNYTAGEVAELANLIALRGELWREERAVGYREGYEAALRHSQTRPTASGNDADARSSDPKAGSGSTQAASSTPGENHVK